MQRGVVVRESPDWTRRRLARLEADGHPSEPRPPDPSTTVLIMLDIYPGWPIVTPRFLFSCWVVDPVFAAVCSRRLVCEEVFLQHIGQAGHADTQEPNPSCSVDSAEERGGH